jgi:hypothetical protein
VFLVSETREKTNSIVDSAASCVGSRLCEETERGRPARCIPTIVFGRRSCEREEIEIGTRIGQRNARCEFSETPSGTPTVL